MQDQSGCDRMKYVDQTGLSWSLALPRFGDANRFSTWVQEQLSRCSEEEFGRRFAAACGLTGIHAREFQHRKLSVSGQTVLAGIRFKGCVTSLPFVDLLAWTGDLEAEWIDSIWNAYSSFAPLAVRSCWPSSMKPPWPGEVDQYVFAGPAAGASHACVSAAKDLSWFEVFQSSYDRWRSTSPLGADVQPADREQLQACLERGHLVVAEENGRFLGVAGCVWKAERSFAGWSIVEEFVIPEAQRQGLGTALQRGLMQQLPAGDLVWGTIDGKNTASLATAKKCGREMVETWWFTSSRRPRGQALEP